MSEEVSNVTHVIICLLCRTLSRFFTSDFPHRHTLTLHLSLPHFWFYYSPTHLLPILHLPFLTLRCKCWLSCIDISPWQMKCDHSLLARTPILMISVLCQHWERQQEGWEDRSMVMMRMEDLGCILALQNSGETWIFLRVNQHNLLVVVLCTAAHHQKPNESSISLAEAYLMTCPWCEVKLYQVIKSHEHSVWRSLCSISAGLTP